MAKESEKAVAATVTKKAETKFPLATLKQDCVKVYGISSSTFAGATMDLPDGEYTIEEVRTVINKWLKKEVK